MSAPRFWARRLPDNLGRNGRLAIISSRDGVLPERTRRSRAAALAGVGRVAVIVAAYRARREWLSACLRSIDAQVLPPTWDFEVRIGVDGCPETSRLLLELGRAHWYSAENVGPYLIRNSLMALTDVAPEADGPVTHYATFDIDDVMHPTYLGTLVHLAGSEGIAGSARRRIDAQGHKIGRVPVPYAHGVAVYSAGALAKLGGFLPWRTVADDNLIRRAEAAGVRVVRHAGALYDRRRHGQMLSKRDDAPGEAGALNGDERMRLYREGVEAIKRGELRVEPEVVELEWRAA